MSPDEIRIAIAEAHGFSDFGWQAKTLIHDVFVGWNGGPLHVPVPDYLNDLDAVQAATKVCIKDWNKFVCMLAKVIVGDARPKAAGNDYHVATAALLCATPQQWCEAVLRTLDLWKEE